MISAEDRAEFVGLAGRLLAYRVRQGVSQREAARRMGVTAGMLRSWELGLVVPSAVYFIAWVRSVGLFVEVTDAEPEGGQ